MPGWRQRASLEADRAYERACVSAPWHRWVGRKHDPLPQQELRHPRVRFGTPAADEIPAGNLRAHLPTMAYEAAVKALQPEHPPRLRGRKTEHAR